MKPSRRNNLSAAAAVILLLFIVAVGSMHIPGLMYSLQMAPPVGAKRAACSHLSGVFPGPCYLDATCAGICVEESSDNINGACDGFPSRCFCETRCPP
ncbi:unnamed protein product [Urochloa decumbens]|uniref:Knottins-like domain-containing protein n=1 Tax=Urochloa decumbens TaxID=240449 RepID=A0ABC9BK35_9POAL